MELAATVTVECEGFSIYLRVYRHILAVLCFTAYKLAHQLLTHTTTSSHGGVSPVQNNPAPRAKEEPARPEPSLQ